MRKGTYRLLNYLTLNIYDDEMKLCLKQFRFQWLENLYYPALFVYIIDLIWCLFSYFTNKSPLVNLALGLVSVIIFIIWSILRVTRFKLLTIYLPVFFISVHSVCLNFLYRDLVPRFLVINDKEKTIYTT